MRAPLSYPAAVAATLAALVGSGAALHRCSRLAAGHPLLGAVAAACIALNFAAPLLLFDPNTCHSTRGMTTFAISWIASSKALALFCGRGQLAALLSLAMYGWLGFQLDILTAIAHPWLGLRLQPLFRPPWTEAQGPAAFWGRCWNLACSNAVRISVYEPLCEGTFIRRGPGAAAPALRVAARRHAAGGVARRGGNRALALCAGFVTSGAMHEFIMWAIAGQTTRGYWFAFFALQAPLILAERHLVAALGQRGVKLPAPLRTAATLCMLMAVAHPLFYNPLDRILLFGRYIVLWRSWFAAAGETAAGALLA
ncbi:hypothetical protein ABPG75_011618 [Micractinium tetrahymenae]